MSSDTRDSDTHDTNAMDEQQSDLDQAVDTPDDGDSKQPERLDLKVQIDERNACQRHITVTISRGDIDRYIDEAFAEMMPSAQVPGFRAGRAPRKLVESRFRKDVAQQVKGTLLMDSVTQVTEDEKLAAISEPDLDPSVIEVPEEGPMTFEFDLEVRPNFDMPEWRGLNIKQQPIDTSDEAVDKKLTEILREHSRRVPKSGPAEPGDFVATDVKFLDGDTVLSELEEEVICLRPLLSFNDANIEGFDRAMTGVCAGESRRLPVKMSNEAPNENLRGKETQAVFDVLEVRKLELPELTPAFLHELGDFEDEQQLREAVRDTIARQGEFDRYRDAREQITEALTKSANWDLPQELLNRQAQRELDRSLLELRRNGFSEADIRAFENDLRQNSLTATARSLREHFILERLAEEQNVEDTPEDTEMEINLIARQLGESPRRVRAKLEKQGQLDALRNQIIERKTVQVILAEAKFTDVPAKSRGVHSEAIDHAIGGKQRVAIPEAHSATSGESEEKHPVTKQQG